MKILFSHLKQFLQDDVSNNEISALLFQLGHENTHDNKIIDVEFTPNKGDCLSVIGIARDLNSLISTKIDIPVYKKEVDTLDFNFKNAAINFCPKISFCKIEIEKPANKYMDYLEDYFNHLSIKKNNFFTDISNYLAYETGQPTHCYDLTKVSNGIKLEQTNSKERFESLTGKVINLYPEEYVFTGNEKVINFAGIMGGELTKCNEDTCEVLIECAYFQPDLIIGKSLKYDIQSDAAYKFERGVDINSHEKTLRRFIHIVEEHAKIKSVSYKEFIYKTYENKKINANYDKINDILGTNYDEPHIKNILRKLGFQCSEVINIPSWRNDIDGMNDLAEEVARVVGYNNIKISSFNNSNKIESKHANSKINKIRNYLVGKGFFEIINDPFVECNEEFAIKVDNPLDSNRRYIRTNIYESLIKNLDYNEKRQKDSVKLFEISEIYVFDKEQKLNTKTMLSIIISGRVGNNFNDFSKKLDINYLKDVIANLKISEKEIFEIKRDSIKSKLNTKIYAINVDITNVDDLLIQDIDMNQYKFKNVEDISDFPSSVRDLSISIKNIDLLEILLKKIFNKKLKHLKQKFIFDFYKDDKNHLIKIGLRFIFQSIDKTLEDAEIDFEIKKIFDIIDKYDEVEIPGLK